MALLIVNCIFFEIKNNFFFVKHEFLYSEVCNFLRRFLVMLPAFLLPICLFFFFFIHKDIKQSNQRTSRLLSES